MQERSGQDDVHDPAAGGSPASAPTPPDADASAVEPAPVNANDAAISASDTRISASQSPVLEPASAPASPFETFTPPYIPLDLSSDLPETEYSGLDGDRWRGEEIEPPKRPRVWPTVLVALGVTPVTMVVAGLFMGIVAATQVDIKELNDPKRLEVWMNQFIQTPTGFVTMALTAQAMIFLCGLIPAMLSKEPTSQRLALVKPKLPLWTTLAFMLATPIIGILTYILMPFLRENPGESMKYIDDTIRGARGAQAFWFIFIISVLPGIGEELLFRGYVQSRLIKAWGAPFAILFATATFAVMHMDPPHIAAVVPLGLWMGIIAWRSGSIWPAIGCHAFNNLWSCVLSRMGLDENNITEVDALFILLLPALAMIMSLVAIIRPAPAATDPDSVERPGASTIEWRTVALVLMITATGCTVAWMARGLMAE